MKVVSYSLFLFYFFFIKCRGVTDVDMNERRFASAQEQSLRLTVFLTEKEFEGPLAQFPKHIQESLVLTANYMYGDARLRDFKYIYQDLKCKTPGDYKDLIAQYIVNSKNRINTATPQIREANLGAWKSVIESTSVHESIKNYLADETKKLEDLLGALAIDLDKSFDSKNSLQPKFNFLPENPSVYHIGFFGLLKDFVGTLHKQIKSNIYATVDQISFCMRNIKILDKEINDIINYKSFSIAEYVDYQTGNERRIALEMGLQFFKIVNCGLPCEKIEDLFSCSAEGYSKAEALIYKPPTFTVDNKRQLNKDSVESAGLTNRSKDPRNLISLAVSYVIESGVTVISIASGTAGLIAAGVLVILVIAASAGAIFLGIKYFETMKMVNVYQKLLLECNKYIQKEYTYLDSLKELLTEYKSAFKTMMEDTHVRETIANRCIYNSREMLNYISNSVSYLTYLDTYMSNSKIPFNDVKSKICDCSKMCNKLKMNLYDQ